jgi:putative ABC transport system ATP-binding protein/ATP-binding cassette subfamily B protein
MNTEMDLEEEFARAPLAQGRGRRLIGYLRPHRRAIVYALLLEMLWVVLMWVEVRLIKIAQDDPVKRGDVALMTMLSVAFVTNVVFRAWFTVWEIRNSTRIGIEVIHAVRRDVFEHVQRLSMRYFDRTKQGRIIARADRDVDQLEHLVVHGPVVLVNLAFSMVFGFAMMALGAPSMAAWLLAAVPVLWALTRAFEKFGYPAYRRVRETHSAISAHVAETITGVRVVMAFSAEDRELARLEKRQDAYRDATLRSVRLSNAYVPCLLLVLQALTLVSLVVGGHAVLAGENTVGGLMEIVMLVGFVLGPVEGLGGLYNESLVAGAAAERIFLLMDTGPEVKDRPEAVDPGRLRGEIEFDDVSFAYEPDGRHGNQLDHVNLRVAPGETVALVGHTGAGKTSVVNLIARFYEAQHGVVKLDGRDVRAIPQSALHRQMGMVLQESFLFAGSVLDNLRFVSPDLTEAEARAGFSDLGCAEVLNGLSQGLNTDVGERGANLSEGERQIVCFVRALLARPSILVLDEATSAVDTRTEALILHALRELASRQTTVVIAHRLSTIRHADRIVVMDRGRVVEQGSHEELLARGATYAALYREYATT